MVWQRNEWYARSGEFYSKVYASGKCRYCGKVISTPLDCCECSGLKAARDRFKRAIGASGQPQATKTAHEARTGVHNPDKYIEQDTDFKPIT